jgi:hypothetical protein
LLKEAEMRRGCVARVIVMVLLAATTEGAQPAPSAKTAPRDCAGLPATPLAGARITAADAVTTSQAIPVPHCKVLGVIDTEVRFQVLHPTSGTAAS